VTDERDGIRIKANFNASTSKLLPDVVLIASQAKDTVAATASEPPPLLKIPRIARENRSTSGILAWRVVQEVPSVKDVPVLMNPRFVLTCGTPLVAPVGQGINLFSHCGPLDARGG
jgi:hypothetical protein